MTEAPRISRKYKAYKIRDNNPAVSCFLASLRIKPRRGGQKEIISMRAPEGMRIKLRCLRSLYIFLRAESAKQQSPGRKPRDRGKNLEALEGRRSWLRPQVPLIVFHFVLMQYFQIFFLECASAMVFNLFSTASPLQGLAIFISASQGLRPGLCCFALSARRFPLA
jgi:hypothetical protein